MRKNDIYYFLKKKILRPKEIAKILFWNQTRGNQTNPYPHTISEYIRGYKPVLDNYELDELIETTTDKQAIQGNKWSRLIKLTGCYDLLANNYLSEFIILINEMTLVMMHLSNQITFDKNIILTQKNVSRKLENYEFFSINLNKSLLLKDLTLEMIHRLYLFLYVFQMIFVHQYYLDEVYDEEKELFSTTKLINLNKGKLSVMKKECPDNLYNYFIHYYEECVLSVLQITKKDLENNLKDYFKIFTDNFFPDDYFMRDNLPDLQKYIKSKFLSYFPVIKNQKAL